jgi:endoglucanase
MRKGCKVVILMLSILLLSSGILFGCTGRTDVKKDISAGNEDKNSPTPSPEIKEPDPEIEQKDVKKVKAFSEDTAFLRGMNMGNALESPRIEGEWGLRIRDEHFPIIKGAGFNLVRIPIRWNAHCERSAPYKINDSFFQRVDHVIDEALSQNFQVMINIHHFDELIEDPEGNKDKYMSLWSQIAERYKDYSKDLMFELLNEPNGKLGPALWNEYMLESLEIVRRTNPDRTVVVGPSNWNNLSDLKYLQLPEGDKNIIATFHFYDPFNFTHQGADWVAGMNMNTHLGTKWNRTTSEQEEIISKFNRVTSWAELNDVHVILGEFGAYSKADMKSRSLYTEYVVKQAELRNISWAYWEFGSGFGAYDLSARKWRPELLNALIQDLAE